MSLKAEYKTVRNEARTVIVEKKSKFIASVFPVSSESDALEKLNAVKKEFSDATHNVYAYVIDENNIFRYSDDGEPSGTAGMPVLDTIRNQDLVDILVVVTRYFGGTLLGTGGLVHAYGASAASGISAAEVITRALCNRIYIKANYTLSGKLTHEISKSGYILEDTFYDTDVTYVIICKISDTDKLIKDFTEITCGSAEISVIDTCYTDLPTK